MAENKTSGTRTTLAAPTRPMINVHERPPHLDTAALLGGGLGLSPGPLTFVSSLFADHFPEPPAMENRSSFSQLLAGAMASPPAFGGGSNPGEGFCKDANLRDPSEKNSGFGLSQLFSASGLLTSPGFFYPSSPFGMSNQQALAQVTAQAAAFTQSQPLDYPVSHLPAADSFDLSRTYKRNQNSYTSNVDKPVDDGYNWRKYGQKPVKGCEFPRSYYKCTHANCPVKKKVERSSDGQITQIIYKGKHNHGKPQNRRGRDSGTFSGFGLRGNMDAYQTGGMQFVESSDSEEGRNRQSRDDGDDDEYDDDDDRASKIRKIDRESGVSMSHRTITDPKIIVQTRSEVDLLDDGYRWRKYGQKVVKGNPHPRSYYKCTTAGCKVRKHIERAETDPKAVITTYEGKHDHDVPAARTSNAPHLRPHNTLSENHSLLNDISFGSSGQTPVILRLKEEKITV